MKGKSFLLVSLLLVIFMSIFGTLVNAGIYPVIQNIGGSFIGPSVTVTNSAGGSITGNAYRLSSTVTEVSCITGSIRLNSVASGSSLNMTIFYSSNGTNFYAGTTVNCPLNSQVSYSINLYGSPKTIVALFIMPNTSTWPSYSYSFWSPDFIQLLTDDTAPSMTLAASASWSPSNTIFTSISDSQSGISEKKWAYGSQTKEYFYSNGTTFTTSSITVTQNGIYSVYARDNAGNAVVKTVFVLYVDNYISITHPINIDFNINPNNPTPFSAPDIRLINNSRIKVMVSIQSFNSIPGGTIMFTDVTPAYFSNWSSINKTQTKQYIAIGVKVKESVPASNAWYFISSPATFYANITTKTPLGILNPNGAIGNLSILAYCGNAWDYAYSSKDVLTLVFDAY